MQKKFLSSLFLIVLLNLLVKPFYLLGIDAEVQNRVGEAVYGNYFSLLNFSFLLNILLDLGITNYNTRNIAQHPHQVANHFGKILGLRFTLLFLYVGATLVFAWSVGYSDQEYHLLFMLMINQFLVALIQFSRSNFAGLHLFKTDAVISVLDRLILIGLCSLMLWTNVFGGKVHIEWFVYAQTLAYSLSAIISISLLYIKIGKVKLRLKRTFAFYVLKQSFPYALLILLMMMYNRIDAVMLERMLPDGNTAAGIYAQGFRLLDAVNMFALLFAGLLLPIFARLIKKNESVKDMVALSFRLLMGISLIVSITCFFYQQELITLRYPEAPIISSVTFGWLILTFIPVSLTYVFGTLLTANGSLRYLNIMAAFGVVLNVVLNYFLILAKGPVGAAMATLITQGVTALIQMAVAYRIFSLNFGWSFYFRIVVLVISLGLIHYTITQYSVNTLQWLIPYVLLAVLLGFVFKIFRFSDLSVVMKGKEEE